MKNFCLQPSTFAKCEETSGSVLSMSDKRYAVLCPKPRRFGVNAIVNDPIRPFRLHISHQQDVADPRAESDILNIILTKGRYGAATEQTSAAQVASSPPFFCGSPPSRVSNPLVHDTKFGDERVTLVSPPGVASSPSTQKTGCARMNFGNNPAVRIEGFDCLDRDRGSCTIPARA